MGRNMNFSDLRVLLVEPSHVQQRILVQQLGGLGVWNVEAADGCEAAMRELADRGADLVVSALHMEGESGADLVVRMRQDERYRDVPFVLLSSERDVRLLEPVRQCGVTAMLSKPCAPADLERALERVTEILDPNVEEQMLDLESMHVLLVDDSSAARRYMAQVLGGLGVCNITQAQDGREAVELLSSAFFDVVITDYNMPNLDGQGLLEHIRNESSQRSIPVMMVTSERDAARLAAVRDAGVSDICDKPFEPERVKAVLEGLIG
ncbi:MAG: response regulator [Deltaproteobacteria bacterium]